LRGFGTFIMRELMDDVCYTESGTRLRLRKRLQEERPR
jgi:anti-sigma regulatory factor (Ser/Thr protein kinase)